MTILNHHIAYIQIGFSRMKNEEDFVRLLNYAKRLLIGEKVMPFTVKQLNYYSNPNNFDNIPYTKFLIKKKSGGSREINAPAEGLKLIQRCINIILQCVYNPPKSATGFIPNKSIVDNAIVHSGNNYVYNIDLKDFFPSIDQARVWVCLKNPPFNLTDNRQLIANLIASLCCTKLVVERKDEQGDFIKIEKSVLPQGAPTSPTISNIVAQRLDILLIGVAKRFNLRYSRYADDITFSSMHNVYQKDSEFIKELWRVIEDQNFIINENKVRLQEKSAYRQEVTGLVVNEKVNIKREYIKKIRLWLYLWETYGYERASYYFLKDYVSDRWYVKPPAPNFANVLLGKLNYLKMVIGSDDKRYKKLSIRFHKLREKIDPSVLRPKKKEIPHKPKDTVTFLKLFEDRDAFKFLTHDFDNTDEEFSRSDIVKKAKEVYEKVRKDLVVPEILTTRFHHYAFHKKPKWWTWEKGTQSDIFLGWSGKKLIDWCNDPINESIHPFKDSYYLDNMITPFKNCIEVRLGYLPKLFQQVIDKKLDKSFDVEYIDLKKARFYTDVNIFQSGLNSLFTPFKEIANENNNHKIQISFNREKIGETRLKVIKIIHFDSMPLKFSDDEDLIKGDLKEAKERFKGLCNWSIEAKFEDGFKRINILNDNQDIQYIETIEKEETGFTHILSFY